MPSLSPGPGRARVRASVRYTPELVFELDDSLKYGAHMYDLLSRLSAQEKHEETQDADDT